MQPPQSDPERIAFDYGATATQEETQPTQISESSSQRPADTHLWGYLIPCSAQQRRIDFHRDKKAYRVGRNRDERQGNDHVLTGMKISNQHCEIKWDGREEKTSTITVHDNSSNGTFINGEKIGKGRYGVLREGNEIAFGTPHPQPGFEDYRFIYRHLAAGPPNEGLYANYDVTEELGKGSFATVMKAMSKANGHWYAVKMIHNKHLKRSATTLDANGRRITVDPSAALHKEVQILQRLQHPNICQLKEVFYEENYIHLVLEWVPGGDLLDYIVKRGGLPEDESQHITYQLCEALAYIHSQGIAHRDLKPENVLLTNDTPPQVKVADFGLAKAIDSLTMLRTMCGTPSYLAPEVVSQNGGEGYQKVVDSWSVGVIVFSMLTNASPFIDPSYAVDVKTKILERQIDWTSLAQANISDDAVRFIQRLLEHKPTNRMTLSDAMHHPWLAHFHAESSAKRERTATPPLRDLAPDVSMRSAAKINAEPTGCKVPGAFPSSQDPQRVLQRRRKILEDARDAGAAPFEPTPEMIQNAQREDGDEPPVESPVEQPRSLKRKAAHESDSSLSPMPEDVDLLMANMEGALVKRGKAADGAVALPARRLIKGARGRGKSSPSSADDDLPRVRRSNRLGGQNGAVVPA
ncbi:hypothetical protein PHLGIDRAFT_107386 [Phlebiopsis gigantea 11061_1 CR5-6]|uniref:Pkinase-domain-containing protein n=1 Tax=Phlebiopsis gigantea (strain 11061_1 CR5-6) TaxID=745531 RepID=A0A0C3S9E3_PHLG1|nr:hypothetical protein PHLGIDRAFT_107386 [Phlebiopsis gigantea 11061_1 CR5-6]